MASRGPRCTLFADMTSAHGVGGMPRQVRLVKSYGIGLPNAHVPQVPAAGVVGALEVAGGGKRGDW